MVRFEGFEKIYQCNLLLLNIYNMLNFVQSSLYLYVQCYSMPCGMLDNSARIEVMAQVLSRDYLQLSIFKTFIFAITIGNQFVVFLSLLLYFGSWLVLISRNGYVIHN